MWSQLLRERQCILVVFAIGLLSVKTGHAATTIVGDGGDLVAAVANAASGDVIEVDSNQTFSGVLSWDNKSLTIEAGSGYSPTIGGVSFLGSLGGTFIGLRIPASEIFSQSSLIEFDNNVFLGDLRGGSGGVQTPALQTAIFRNNQMQNVDWGYTGGPSPLYNASVLFDGNQIQGNFDTNALGDGNLNCTIQNNNIAGQYTFDAVGTNSSLTILVSQNKLSRVVSVSQAAIPSNITLNRNSISGPLVLVTSPYSTGTLRITNNILLANATSAGGPGLSIDSEHFGTDLTNGTFTNNTIVGYNQGIALLDAPFANFAFKNMLLDNAQDLSGVQQQQISSSLISDGTFAGTNGNFSGTPLLDANGFLLPGSIGIDAGDNTAAQSLAVDLLGNPRIVDGNGDGIATVDVGAIEVVPEPSALVLAAMAGITLWLASRQRGARRTGAG